MVSAILKGWIFKTAGRFKTRISQIKKIKAGEPVGYGCADVSDNDRIIAILPAGYADGLNRNWVTGLGTCLLKVQGFRS